MVGWPLLAQVGSRHHQLLLEKEEEPPSHRRCPYGEAMYSESPEGAGPSSGGPGTWALPLTARVRLHGGGLTQKSLFPGSNMSGPAPLKPGLWAPNRGLRRMVGSSVLMGAGREGRPCPTFTDEDPHFLSICPGLSLIYFVYVFHCL